MPSKKEIQQQIARVRARMKAEAKPFDDTSAAARAERIRRSKEDDFYFFKTYIPHYFTTEAAEFHEEIIELTKVQDEPVVIAAPREHAKSTLCTFAVPVADICLERKHFIIIISDTEDLAADFNVFIQLELQENERIRADFGDLKGYKWEAKDFTTRNGIRVKARGRGQRLRGIRNRQYRPDRVIVDDFENDKNVKNPKLIKEAVDWILTAVLGSLAEGYSFMMIGTVLAKKSVLTWFLNAKDDGSTGSPEQPLYITRIYKAIKDDGEPLWPAKWPIERLLKKKRQIGTINFNKEFQNDPRDEEGLFRQEWFKYYAPEEIVGKPLAIYDAGDASVGKNESADYRAFIKVGRATDGTIYVLDADIKKRSVDSFVTTAYLRQKEQPALVIGIETNSFQAVLIILFNREAEKMGRHLPIKEIDNTVNKEIRITRLSPLVERGVIRFRKHHSDQDLLIEQLIYFPSTTVNDDGPDALEMAVSLAEMYAGAPVKYTTVKGRRFKGQRGAY
jgi:predicted phage terminase large subunit-like protein